MQFPVKRSEGGYASKTLKVCSSKRALFARGWKQWLRRHKVIDIRLVITYNVRSSVSRHWLLPVAWAVHQVPCRGAHRCSPNMSSNKAWPCRVKGRPRRRHCLNTWWDGCLHRVHLYLALLRHESLVEKFQSTAGSGSVTVISIPEEALCKIRKLNASCIVILRLLWTTWNLFSEKKKNKSKNKENSNTSQSSLIRETK